MRSARLRQFVQDFQFKVALLHVGEQLRRLLQRGNDAALEFFELVTVRLFSKFRFLCSVLHLAQTLPRIVQLLLLIQIIELPLLMLLLQLDQLHVKLFEFGL